MEYRIGYDGALMTSEAASPFQPALVDMTVVAEIGAAIGRDALSGLIHRHLDGVARSLQLVDAWCASGQWSEVSREAHRMKGSAATLGFVRLSGLWVDVENRSAVAADADVKALVARIRVTYRELRAWAASRFASGIGAA